MSKFQGFFKEGATRHCQVSLPLAHKSLHAFSSFSSPEFKRALRNLGARYPEAYDDFVKLLQPSETKVSRVRVRSRDLADEAEVDEAIVATTVQVQESAAEPQVYFCY